MNKGGWDSESCQHTCNMVYVCAGIPTFSGRWYICNSSSTLQVYRSNNWYGASHFTLEQMNAAGAYPVAQGVMSILAVVANVICIAVIIKRAIEQKKNPYKNEIFAGTKDFEEAMDRA